jgi:RNA polymerase sigma-70 factor (ECF subfamily)
MSQETGRAAGSAVGVADAMDAVLVTRLRSGDASAFEEIVDGWSPAMLRLARSYVSTDASAEEVVQDTWLAVLKGLDGFEGRSALKTWVFRILTNVAKTRGVREHRVIPVSALGPAVDDDGPTVDVARFQGPDSAHPGAWTDDGAPQRWEPSPETLVLSAEIRGLVEDALAKLPERQRRVVELRDVLGFDADEVCAALDVSPANQRVLLHRGRAKIRSALEDYYRRTPDQPGEEVPS